MSIFFDSKNVSHWYYQPDEIGYRISAATLTKSLENEIDFDPRSGIFVFHNGKEIDRLFLNKLQEEANLKEYSGFMGAFKALFKGKKDVDTHASLFVLKRGRIFFEAQQVGSFNAKDYFEVNCDCVVSATIVNPENFVINAIKEVNHPEYAIKGNILDRQNKDQAEIDEIIKKVAELKNARVELKKELSWWNVFSKEQRSLHQRLEDINTEIEVSEKRLHSIRVMAAESYEKEISKRENQGFDYYVFTASDLYKAHIERIVTGVLQRLVGEYTAEELSRTDLSGAVSEIIRTNINIVRRLEDIGIELHVEDMRFVSNDEKEVIEKIREAAKEARQKKWQLENRVQNVSYNREEHKVVIDEHEVKLDEIAENYEFERGKEQLFKDNTFAQTLSNLNQQNRMNPVKSDIHQGQADFEVKGKSIEAEKRARIMAINDLTRRNEYKSEKEFQWFKNEMARQGLLNQEEFDKLNDGINDAKRERRWASEDADTKHGWDREELDKRHESFMNSLSMALGLEEAKAKKLLDDFKRQEAIVNLEHLYLQEDMALDHELGEKDKKLDHYLNTKRKNDDYDDERKDAAFDRRRKEDEYADERSDVKFDRTKKYDDYMRDKKSADDAAALDTAKAEFEHTRNVFEHTRNVDEHNINIAGKTQSLAHEDLKFKAELKEQADRNAFERQMAALNAMNAQEINKMNINRGMQQDRLQAEVVKAQSADDVKKTQAQLETARLQSEEHYRAAAATGTLEGMQQVFAERKAAEDAERARQDAREAREFELEKMRIQAQLNSSSQANVFQHEERIAAINSDAAVARAVAAEKDNTISHLEVKAPQKNMYCKVCNKYFAEDAAFCPMCGGKLVRADLG